MLLLTAFCVLVAYPWLAAARLIPGPAVDARAALAVVSPSYHGDGCNRFGCDPWGYMADSGQAWGWAQGYPVMRRQERKYKMLVVGAPPAVRDLLP